MALKIKNWERFQHFKDRKPPWIKLYRDLLDDKMWHDLSDSSAKMLVSLWLLASEDDSKQGYLPPLEEIAFRLRTDIRSIKTRISKLDHWLYQDDIATISDISAISEQYRRDPLETETETETETEGRKAPVKILVDLGVDEQVAKDWLIVRKAKKAPLTNSAIESLKIEASKAGLTVAEAVEICAKRSWQGFNASWDWQGKGGNGNGKRKFSAIQYNAEQLAKSMGAGALSKTVPDVHGEVQPLLPGPGNNR